MAPSKKWFTAEDAKASFNLFCCVYGIGTLGMPGNFSRAGPVLAIVAMAFMAFANIYASLCISKTMLLAPKSVKTYGDLGEWCMGQTGRWLIVCAQVANCILVPCAFLVLGGTLLKDLFPGTFEETSWIIFMAVSLLPVCLIPTLKEGAGAAFAGCLGTIIADVIALVILVDGMSGHPSIPKPDIEFEQVAITFGNLSLAYGAGIVIPALQRQHNEPERMPRVIFVTLGFISILFLVLASTGYSVVGCQISGNLLFTIYPSAETGLSALGFASNRGWTYLAFLFMQLHITIGFAVSQLRRRHSQYSYVYTQSSPYSLPLCDLLRPKSMAATSQFTVVLNRADSFSHSNSFPSLIGLSSRYRQSKLLLVPTSTWRSSKRTFVVKNVSSEPKPKLKDPVADEESPIAASAFAPDASSIASSIKYHAEFTPLFSPDRFDLPKAFFATAQSVRDALIINWNETYELYERLNVKQAYYLSMEFLQGRALLNAIGNLELTGPYAEALNKLGYELENVACQEPDAALGNGGLGRLASCFLDSLATLNYPAWGYGLRYKYGLFKQKITKDGQEEVAENWLEIGNPWEIVRNDIKYHIKFYGKVVIGSDGKKNWTGGEDIEAVAYDVPIPGYKTKNTINLRLWSTKAPTEDFDLSAFNAGEHTRALEALASAEKICHVLYPGDDSIEGKILRLKQQYTLCSASLQDIVARFERRSGANIKWEEFPEKVAVQMNDTHPTLCIPELMRILLDLKGLSWEEAWNITQRTVAYTNHTVLPEALEKWSFELMQKLLPRHVEIIELIDEELIRTIISEYGTADLKLLREKLKELRILENVDLPAAYSDLFIEPEESSTIASTEVLKSAEEADSVDEENLSKLARSVDKDEFVEVDDELESKHIQDKKVEPIPPPLPKMVRMANLCVVGGHAVNGVAEIHSEIVKDEVFNAFYKLWPEKFQNKTNGVTPRRWIRFCNPDLSKLITNWIGSEDWVLNTEKLGGLKKFADNEDLQNQWRIAKRNNKLKAVSFLKEKTGYTVSPDAMFDIQVKRIHEYKRQLLNIFGIVYRYKKMKEMSGKERKETYVPRVCIFGGKAFATYAQAKRIVKFITDVGATVNHDPEIGDLLKVIFVPDYNVSVAELLIPASELSQHISTAGMEASGTSNMKFAMNGCILIGTLDGANVEIRQEVGADNFFLFGAEAHEIAGLRKERAEGKFIPDPRFEEVKEYVRSGVFGSSDYQELIGSLEGNEGFGRADYFLVGKDFPSYIECQEQVDKAYRDEKRWTRMSILNTAGSYKFSSDRTIHEYAKDIWSIKPVELP